MTQIDSSNVSSVELRERAEALFAQARELSTKEFESTMNFLAEKLPRMGKTKKDAVVHLLMMMKAAEAEETLAEVFTKSGSQLRGAKKSPLDLDSIGARPRVGATYKLPSGEIWTRKQKKGPTKRSFAEHARTSTWVSMEA